MQSTERRETRQKARSPPSTAHNGRLRIITHVSDTVAGAHTSAAFYSLIETAKANDLEPMIYLHWLFATLASVDPDDVDAISALLPYRVDRDRIAADLAHEHAHTPAVR